MAALGVGVVAKTILNIILVSNPTINIAGASIGSIVCQILAFLIAFRVLNMKLKIKFDPKKNIIKPAIAAVVMGIIVYFVQYLLNMFIGNMVSTLLAIIVGVGVYGLAIIFMNVLSKEDILMIPFGTKIYNILVKLHLYKEEGEPLR